MIEQAECHQRLTRVFREVFDDDSLRIEDHYTPKHIAGWDSVMHVNLIVTIEDAFGIRFSTTEIASIQSVGDIKELLAGRAKAA